MLGTWIAGGRHGPTLDGDHFATVDNRRVTSPTDLPVPDEGPGPDDDPRRADRADVPRNRKILLILIGVALFAWMADIISKVIVVANLTEGDPVQIIGDTVTLKLEIGRAHV